MVDSKTKITQILQKSGPLDVGSLVSQTGLGRSTCYRMLTHMLVTGEVVKTGAAPDKVYYSLATITRPDGSQRPPEGERSKRIRSSENDSTRSNQSRSVSSERKSLSEDPPLIHLEVTNPVTYLKHWWKKVMGQEGINIRFSFRIRPLTALMIALVFVVFGFGVGRLSILEHTPVAKYLPSPTPTPDPWRDTAFTGLVRYARGRNAYFLVTERAEAIGLVLPENVDLEPFLDRRIFVAGRYNTLLNVIEVADAAAMELLPDEVEMVPTATPVPTLTPTPTTRPTPTVYVSPLPTSASVKLHE